MIEIKPITLNTPNTYRMAVIEGNVELGTVELYLMGNRGYLSHLQATDKLDNTLAFGLGKAVLNLADRLGAVWVTCEEDSMKNFLSPLGFKLECGALWTLSLEHYFDGGCHAPSEEL